MTAGVCQTAPEDAEALLDLPPDRLVKNSAPKKRLLAPKSKTRQTQSHFSIKQIPAGGALTSEV
jgi:hypothetical protein